MLVVDDEKAILDGFRRQFGSSFQILTARSGREAMDRIEEDGQIAVAIVDYRMPEMNGLEFIEQARVLSPATAWIMLSGYADTQLTIETINRGHVFRFLTKPTIRNSVLQAIDEAVDHHYSLLRIQEDEWEKSQQTVEVLLKALSEKDRIADGHARRLADLTSQVGAAMNLTPEQQERLHLLSFMHDLGKIGIPDRILFKPEKLTDDEWRRMRQHPEIGFRIASESPELDGIADLILKHHECWDGNGYPLGIKGKDIPVEARILAVIDAYDAMTNERPYKKPLSDEEAKAELQRCAGSRYDPEVVRHALWVLGNISGP